MTESYTLHLVSHTHWDREWYEPFAAFRSRLVRLVDTLLGILEQEPEFRSFMLDGQSVILEDYLEIRPERRADLEAHIRSGRLRVGPWYVLPDEFLVTGEALTRNLIRGRQVASAQGGGMDIGYTPDSFGHVAQLPQILQGFGIEVAILRRGLADEPVELIWEAPDGSRVLLLYLRDGYGNAARIRYDRQGMVEDLAAARNSLAPHSASSHLLLLHGTDHMVPKPGLPRALSRIEPDHQDRVAHSSLPDYEAAVTAELDPQSLPSIRGALRNPKRHHLLPGVLSTRMPVKQWNQRCQVLLERWAEPTAAWAGILARREGKERPGDRWRRLLNRAWQQLLQNQAHDSICGCSVDAVYEDVDRRFSQSHTLAAIVRSEATESLIRRLDTTPPASIDTSDHALVVFNPLVGPRTDFVGGTLAGIAANPDSGLEVVDDQGRPVPIQEARSQSQPPDSAPSEKKGVPEFLFRAEELPSHGYRTYWLRRGQAAPNRIALDRLRPELESDLLRVKADPDTGTLELLDKDSGLVYPGLNRFVDGGEAGDTYNHCPPDQDHIVDRPSEPPQIQMVETGPVRWTLEIRSTYRLPSSLTPNRRARRVEQVEVPVTSRVSLAAGIRRVEFETRVTNRAQDHRLRVHFPTPFRANSARADGTFLVGPPPLSPTPGGQDWVEQPSPTFPIQSFLWLGNERAGLAVAVRGIPEAEVLPGGNGSEAAITLLRCVGWLSRDDLSTRRGHAGPELAVPGAQCLGTHRFHYALLPSRGDWHEAYQAAQAYLSPLEAFPLKPGSGSLPSGASLLEMVPDSVALTAVKPPAKGKGLILRLCNLEDQEVRTQVRLGLRFQTADRVSLDEERILEPLPLEGGRLLTTVLGPHQVVTIRVS